MNSAIAIAALALLATASAKPLKECLKQPAAWFAGAEADGIRQNILSHQADSGGWPKNTDTTGKPHAGDRSRIQATFDNGATTDELRFLARWLEAHPNDAGTRRAFARGLAHILDAQYANGGWPQFHPPGENYHRHITFNDGSMVRLMEFLREVHREPRYAFVPPADRRAAGQAFDRGIACILKCQIRIDGRPTVWCAQHDADTLRPATARVYELPSFSGNESVGITRLLMSLEKPSPEVRAAVEGAVAWFRGARLDGIRVEARETADGRDRVVVEDPSAPPIWARFYDLASGAPVFCGRDGIPRTTLAAIDHERRIGYAWYGNWPQSLLEKEYPAWKTRR